MKRKPKQDGEIKIEDGIPIPERRYNKGHATVLRKLKVGQSAFFPTLTNRDISGVAQSSFGAGNYMTRREIDIKTGIKGCRIWRTK